MDIEKILDEAYNKGKDTGYIQAQNDLLKWLSKYIDETGITKIEIGAINNHLDILYRDNGIKVK